MSNGEGVKRMNETTEITDETLAIVRNMLPATGEDLALALQIAPSRVAGVIRRLRKSGYPVKSDHGVYRGASQLEEYELAIMEHHEVKYTVSRWTSTAAMFPTPERVEIARLLAEDLDRLEAEVGKHKRLQIIDKRLAALTRERAELVASA